jgi:hypothetical protein
LRLRPLYEDASKVGPNIASRNSGGTLHVLKAPVRNAFRIPTGYRRLIDLQLSSEVDKAHASVFEKGG